jgi:uncharacterized protein (TIGR02118 family)
MDIDGPVKVYALMVKREGLTDDQFHAHWREPHGRLAMQVRDIRRYVQDHTFGAAPEVAGWPATRYDCLPAVWFDSLADARALHTNPDFQESHADEMNLVDRDRLAWLYCTEHVVLAGPPMTTGDPEGWKLTLLLSRLPDIGRAEFDAAIDAATADGSTSLPAVLRATCAMPRTDDTGSPRFDAVIEFLFAGRRELQAATASPALATVLDGLAAVAEPAASELAWTYEERWLWP